MKLKEMFTVLDARRYNVTNHNGSRDILCATKEELTRFAECEVLYITPSTKPGTLEIWLAI